MNFFRGWEAYREGFGKLTGEHWLGKGPHAGHIPCSASSLPFCKWIPSQSQEVQEIKAMRTELTN